MTRLLVFILVLSVTGCGGGTTSSEPRTFDLGIGAPGAALPAVRIGSVRAVAPFEGVEMHYRLAWRNAAEIAAFANTRWAASPPELFRKQLLRAANEKTGKCAVTIEIQEFTQVFATREASEARVELRAWLGSGPGRVMSRNVNVSEPNAGADAISGAAAFARAAGRAIGELGGWIAAQADCR